MNPWVKYTDVDTLCHDLDAELRTARAAERTDTDSGCVYPSGDAARGVVAWSNCVPALPGIPTLVQMPIASRALMQHFRNWLHQGAYGPLSRLVLAQGLRLIIQDAADWRELDFDHAVERARTYLCEHMFDARFAAYFALGIDLASRYLEIRQARACLPRTHLETWPGTQTRKSPWDACWGAEPSQDSEQSGCMPIKAGTRRVYAKSRILPRTVQRAIKPGALELIPVKRWSISNQNLYSHFRNWLTRGGYSQSALYLYGLATRVAFSVLVPLDWRKIDTQADLARVQAWVDTHYTSHATREVYAKGLHKLGEYLRRRQGKRLAPKPVAPPPRERAQIAQTDTPTRQAKPVAPQRAIIPPVIDMTLRAYFEHCKRNWPQDRAHETAIDWWSKHTLPLRGMLGMGMPIETPADVSAQCWYAYLDTRLAAGINPRTLNSELSSLRGWLGWLDDGADGDGDTHISVDARFFKIGKLRQTMSVPRDLPPEQIFKLQRVIELESLDADTHRRWRGVMDLAWFLLMLHAGLRTGEIRRLRPEHIDWERRMLTIDASKNLRSRLAPFSRAASEALNAWITLRADDPGHAETVFADRHKALSQSYCYGRLRTYGQKVGVSAHPHQLRHSCATLLLNAGMPLHQVQTVLGHVSIQTTRGYARSYDGSVAADYTRAMLSVERDLGLEASPTQPLGPAQITALLDSLATLGPLNQQQKDVVARVRAANA